jgi:hypothetical protein
MTSVTPLPILNETTVSFQTWFDTEEDYDYAFFEVSRDGRYFEILDTFNGNSSDWEYKEYDLTSYFGESVFLRFRYSTDEGVSEPGFYVDDISPLPEFETITTISDSLTETSYEITGKLNGTYFYRVRGHNTEHGWGDFSPLQYVLVGQGQDTQPPSLTITRPIPNRLYLNDRDLLPFIATIIIGDITIEAEAVDASGINRVEFIIEGDVRETMNSPPFSWTWKDRVFFQKEISVRAVDYFENTAQEDLMVWKFF